MAGVGNCPVTGVKKPVEAGYLVVEIGYLTPKTSNR